MNRDRSRSPPIKTHPSNGSLALNIKEEENESSPNKESSLAAAAPTLGPSANLLAANYFANNHLKLAENLMNHGGANFLNANLLQSNKSGSLNNDIRTSPEKINEDDGGTATPLSAHHHHHHPMGGFERKDFDFSKVNGESFIHFELFVGKVTKGSNILVIVGVIITGVT